ncbi:MAG TPA: RHS repeat-associated core domain-containing protein [Flavobacteriales bacterium]|nr:RHS repeat-associated core domain-containing protein [Flavobacteriales bacterium]
MGRDGDPSLSPNPNLNVGRDAYALSLGYYGDADYKGIGAAWNDDQPASIAQRPFAPMGMPGIGSTLATQHKPLYNGNIAHTVNTLQPFGLWNSGNGGQGQVLAQVYRYDQLNRLKKARGVEGLTSTNTWDAVTDAATNKYRSQYEYDANGNIVSAHRYDHDENHYDEFSYKYEKRGGRVVRNRLYELYDDADAGNAYVNEPNGAKDIGYTPTITDPMDPAYFDEENPDINDDYNYGYDALGNLVRDDREDIEVIHWTVAGKVDSIQRPGASSRSPLKFRYGASGQRVSKQVGDYFCTDAGAYREHYIRDAQGNIMATYRYTLIPVPNTTPQEYDASLKLNERPLYGSSRLGSLRKELELHSEPFDPEDANPVQAIDLNYEITDHLGNVCAVVTGRLLDGNLSGTPKQAELLSAQGYEPFGSLLPGRNYSSDAYRFGFGGMPKDDEVHGATGTSYDFGARLYDPRVGRWLSLDPLAEKFPSISPYAYVGNMPIWAKDPDGRDIVVLSAQNNVAGLGHAAVLIGNDETGWRLYSKNGTYGSSGASGKSNKNPESGIYFKSLREFADSESNLNYVTGEDTYTSAFRITTSAEIDAKMEAAAQEQVSSWYDVSGLVSGSCIDVCSDALSAGGLDPGYETETIYSYDGPYEARSLSMVPNKRYEKIVANNPGKDVTKDIRSSHAARERTQAGQDFLRKVAEQDAPTDGDIR